MNEDSIGKDVVDAAGKVHRELGPGLMETMLERRGLLDFCTTLIERIVNGLEDENLGVFASLRVQSFRSEPGGASHAASPHG